MHKRQPRIETTAPASRYDAEPVSSPKGHTPVTPGVRNSLLDSMAGRTPTGSRHRRTSTAIEKIIGSNGGGSFSGKVEDALDIRRVNTWALMRAIIRQSLRSALLAILAGIVFFSIDIALHKAWLQDEYSTPCTAQSAPGGQQCTYTAPTWIGMDLENWRSVGGYMPEVVFAIVGIALSIVSLILQLSATRYNPFVVELFFRDSVSTFTLHFFVGTSVFCLWINCLLGWTTDNFIPRVSVVVMMIAVTMSSLLIIPFFKYVFAFISPKTQIDIMVSEALEAALRGYINGAANKEGDLLARQTRVLDSMQHLSEYALSAVHQKDAAIAFHCISNMGLVVLEVMRMKPSNPKAQELFSSFRETDETLALPAFENVNANSRSEVYSDWLLWMALFEFNSLFAEAGQLLADGCQQITNAVLAIGVQGVEDEDLHTIRLVMKFFNTFMRTGVNAGNIKLCCRVLNDYRKLVEAIMQAPNQRKLGDEVVQGVRYMTYYAHIAYVKQVYFIAEIVAYDISMICEAAHHCRDRLQPGVQDQIVGLLLEVDEVPDDKAQLETLRGVRKAQIKLAAFYLVSGERRMAALIREDMADEPPERLESIQEELEAVQSATFWELEDRGYNFEYMSPDRKGALHDFMNILAEDGGAGGEGQASANSSSAPPSRRERRRARRTKSTASLAVAAAGAGSENGSEHGGSNGRRPWREAANDCLTPGSTPSSLRPGRLRVGSASNTPSSAAARMITTPGGGALKVTVQSGKDTPSSLPGGVPGSATSSRGSSRAGDMTPLIARIPEETLRASVEGSLEVVEGSADAAEAKAEEEEKEEESGREGQKVPP